MAVEVNNVSQPSFMMIDIESLSLRPNAFILSIGAVVFNTNDILYSQEFRFAVRQPHVGEHVDIGTIKWWFNQSDAARQSVFGTMDIRDGLCHLNRMYQSNGCIEVWANGPQFDICAIENAMRVHVTGSPPWKYNEVRDLRTALRSDRKHIINKGVAHNALDDAKFQAELLIASWKGKL